MNSFGCIFGTIILLGGRIVSQVEFLGWFQEICPKNLAVNDTVHCFKHREREPPQSITDLLLCLAYWVVECGTIPTPHYFLKFWLNNSTLVLFDLSMHFCHTFFWVTKSMIFPKDSIILMYLYFSHFAFFF